jgi:hypothetical protein
MSFDISDPWVFIIVLFVLSVVGIVYSVLKARD